MKCHEARELLIHYSNGEVGRSERELLQAHLAQCESCFRHLQSLSSIEQHVRTGLHEAADSVEPSSMAWQDLSHKLANRRNERSNSNAPFAPLPLVLRLVGGLSATVAFAVLVGVAIVSPNFSATHAPMAVTEDALPLPAETLNTTIGTGAAVEFKTMPELDRLAATVHTGISAPQKQSRMLLQSEPDSFPPQSQMHDTPEMEFISQTNCSYCLKMR